MNAREFIRLGSASRDDIFIHDRDARDFAFDQQVVDVFPDMISRSVPGYWSVNDRTALLTRDFYQPGSKIYDLGVSLGSVTWAIIQVFSPDIPPIIAVDNSAAMISRLTENIAGTELADRIEIRQEDVCRTELTNASVIILNYTLQFVDPDLRLLLLAKIHRALLPGGVLLMAEKITMESPEKDRRVRASHHDWKFAQGYSREEVEAKSQSISKVMPVERLSVHAERFQKVGFSSMDVWNQQYNFAAMLVRK